MDDKQQAIIEKVLKLMELAKDERGHEGERESAQRMAAKLMAEYAIDFADLRSGKIEKGYFEKFDLDMQKDCVDWEGNLANGICRAFDVKLVQQKHPWVLMYCGHKTDIEIAVFFFKYLRRTVGVMTQKSFTKQNDRRTFAYGMVSEITRRMKDLYEKRNEAFSSDSRALMVVKTDGLDKFVREQFPHLTSGRAVKLTGSPQAHAAGREAGAKVNISRPIGGSATARGAIA